MRISCRVLEGNVGFGILDGFLTGMVGFGVLDGFLDKFFMWMGFSIKSNGKIWNWDFFGKEEEKMIMLILRIKAHV